MSGGEQEDICVTVEVERSHINDAGAALFGTRTNTSEGGKINFGHLMVSQPGPIQLKITTKRTDVPPADSPLESVPSSRTLLFKFLVSVSNSPEMEISNHCLFIFEAIQSPFGLTQAEVNAWNDVSMTTVVGRVPSARLLETLSCLPVFFSWGVRVYISPLVSATSGTIIEVQYRAGIEAVWTGHGMPRVEMTSYERLGIPVGSTDFKQIRSAYHEKSLKWHPDRWSSILKSVANAGRGGDAFVMATGDEGGAAALYKLAVQEAFELVAEAYEDLMSTLAD